MRYFDVKSKQITKLMYGTDSAIEMSEILLKDGEYVNRAVGFDKSQKMKQAWREKRHRFIFGMKSANRRSPTKLLRNSLLTDLKSAFKDDKTTKESLTVSIPFAQKFEFLRKVSLLEAALAKEATYIDLEEQLVETILYVDEALKGLASLKRAVLLNKPISYSKAESVLLALGGESYVKDFCVSEAIFSDNETLVERFIE